MNSTDLTETHTTEQSVGHETWISGLRYTKSFLAKLYLGDKELKDVYCAVLNKFSAYEGVNARTAYSGVVFSYKRKPLAKAVISGKYLTLYLAVEPSAHSQGKYRLTDVKNVKKYSALPSKYRVRSKGGLKFALVVIDEIIAGLALKEKASIVPATHKDFPSESFSNLLSRGLIRQINLPVRQVSRPVPDGNVVIIPAESAEVITVPEESAAPSDKSENEITEDVFTDTVNVNSSLIQRHAEYGELFNSFTGGEIRFIRKKQVRSVDERWVNAIEDCLPALDEVMRNPSHFIEETEELLPIERTKKVTTQSIKHLSQHTGLISRIENDVVIPSKLLNVFRDESVMTYENKFVNTLLIRLYNFVVGRYETASEYGANAEKYEFYFTDGVENDEERGKVSLKLEMIKPSEQAEKNRFFGSDLWERVKKLNGIITDYSKSDFAMQMGNVCIFPPVVRTNPILKNKNLHQCLELWEFLEGYDDGDGITVSEEEISAQDIQKEFARQGLAEQYLAFRKFVSAAGIGSAVEPSADAEDNFGAAETSEKPITAETAEESKYDELALLVDAALCAEEIALNEGKAKQDALRAEREELLRKQAEEESKEEFKEEIKSAVDTLPVEYPEYSYNETPSDGMISENGDTEENDGDKDDADVAKTEENGETVIYVKSFAAKLSFASERLKGYYCEIANAFLSRKGVRERTAFDHVDFYRGRKTLARVIIIGKSVRVFFALSPTEQDKKYRIVDKSSVKRYEATPSMVKVRGPLGLKHALELIDIVCDGLEKTALTAVRTVGDYPEKTFEEALDGGEIRRRVVSAPRGGLNAIRVMPHEDSVADEMVFRAVKEKPEYDYSEEAAAYLKEIEKKGGKKVVLKTVKSSDIAKAIKRVDEEETAAAAERENARKAEKAAEKVLIEGENIGDPLILRAEATSKTIAEEKPKKEDAKQEKAERPAEVPPDGDVLAPKPITMEEIADIAQKNNVSDEGKERRRKTAGRGGLFARLFGRKNKK